MPKAHEGVFLVCCRKLTLHHLQIADQHAGVKGLEGYVKLRGCRDGVSFLAFCICLCSWAPNSRHWGLHAEQ